MLAYNWRQILGVLLAFTLRWSAFAMRTFVCWRQRVQEDITKKTKTKCPLLKSTKEQLLEAIILL